MGSYGIFMISSGYGPWIRFQFPVDMIFYFIPKNDVMDLKVIISNGHSHDLFHGFPMVMSNGWLVFHTGLARWSLHRASLDQPHAPVRSFAKDRNIVRFGTKSLNFMWV